MVHRCLARSGGYGKLGKAVSWHTVSLHYDHGWGTKKIAKRLNGPRKLIHYRTIRRLLKRFRKTCDVRTPKAGTRESTSSIASDIWDFIVEALITYPAYYLDELQDLARLARDNFATEIPLSTLCATLNRRG